MTLPLALTTRPLPSIVVAVLSLEMAATAGRLRSELREPLGRRGWQMQSQVLHRRLRFQMRRVHAQRVLAAVMEMHARGHWPDEQLVGKAMRLPSHTSSAQYPVRFCFRMSSRGRPYPQPAIFAHHGVEPEASRCIIRWSS